MDEFVDHPEYASRIQPTNPNLCPNAGPLAAYQVKSRRPRFAPFAGLGRMTTMAVIGITGSTDGIGRATARVLLADGHRVLVHARSRERGESSRKHWVATSRWCWRPGAD